MFISFREWKCTRHLDYEAGEQEVGGGGDVDGGSISVLPLILQPRKHQHPPPPRLHHVQRALWLPLVAAEGRGGPAPRAAELPSGETQRRWAAIIHTWKKHEDQLILTGRPWGQCDCEGWGQGRRCLPAHSRSRKEAMATDKEFLLKETPETLWYNSMKSEDLKSLQAARSSVRLHSKAECWHGDV